MARPNRLTPAAVKAAKKPGRYGDGECLFLIVSPGGSKSWVARVTRNGRQRDIGLGSVSMVTLAQAREACRSVRLQVRAGVDPVAERRRSAGVPTFRSATVRLIDENRSSWSNAKHGAQWLSTLETYAFPKLGDRTVDEITPADAKEVLLEVWLEKPETARRVRQRIAAVLDWAHTEGYRPDRVLLPSAGKGLPRQPEGVRHMPALPYSELPEFMVNLRSTQNISRLALEFLIMTARRSGEVRGAIWAEIDLNDRLWTIPGERVKTERRKADPKPHIVTLTPAALAVLKKAAPYRAADTDLVFPGLKRGKGLSDATLCKLLRVMEAKDENGRNAVAHGFRSTFRTWAADETNYPRELAEKALGHKLPSDVEAAYNRAEMVEKRRALLATWDRYAAGNQNVLQIVS